MEDPLASSYASSGVLGYAGVVKKQFPECSSSSWVRVQLDEAVEADDEDSQATMILGDHLREEPCKLGVASVKMIQCLL